MSVMRNKATKKHSKKNLNSVKTQVFKQLKTLWENDTVYVKTVSTFVYQTWVRLEEYVKPLRRHAMDISVLTFVAVLGVYFLFPTVANADVDQQVGMDQTTLDRVIASMQNKTTATGRLPQAKDAEPRRSFTIPITAYTSEVGQTDDSPCITASGLDVCERNIENVVAANFLPIGTRVRIPEFYGDRVFYVEDRMNRRYDKRMDIWMKKLSDAKTFGLKYTTIEVF